MRAATTTTTVTTAAALFCNHSRQFLSPLEPNKSRINQVSSLLSQFYFPPKNRLIAAFTSLANTRLSPSSSVEQKTQTQIKNSSIECSSFDKSILLKCNTLFNNKDENKLVDASLKDLLLDLSGVVPHITRKFRRFHELKPENVLELFLGYQIECGTDAIRARKVETLWKIFNWGNTQNEGFKNLPRTYQVMASMLIQVGMLKEFELLFVEMESKGISLNDVEIFSNLIQSYVGVGEWEKAVSVYDQMKGQGQGRGFVPSLSVYCSLINLLVEMKKTPLAFRVCLDMLSMGVVSRDIEIATVENVVRLLCRVEKIQEARKLVKEVMGLGFEPSSFVVNEIASGYCEKNDFDDLFGFFVAVNRVADVHVVNKIIHTLCSKFSVVRADVFRQKLESLGFKSDETTFGILIGWSCHDKNLKSAFMYLSEILSRGLTPDIYSYNALIAAIFTEEGMRDHARHVFDEMVDNGPTPMLSTFTTMLAGYCKARRFEDAKTIIHEMVKMNLIEHSSLKNPLSKAFLILGLNPLTVRLKRDNDVKHSRTEFYDDLGNGLFLDTDDLDVYEKRVTQVLERSMLPDFNDLVIRECSNGDLRCSALDKMVRWGQEPSLLAFSVVVKTLCTTRSHSKSSIRLVNEWPKLTNHLDRDTLDFLIRKYCEKGFTHQGWLLFREMLRSDTTVDSETYTVLIKGLCKKKIDGNFDTCWDIGRNIGWSPSIDDCKTLWECLFRRRMLNEASELLERKLVSSSRLRSEIYDAFLETLCATGFTHVARVLVGEMIHRGRFIDYKFDYKVYNYLLRGFCNEKKYSAAFEIVEELMAKNIARSLDVSIQTALVRGLCLTGKLKEAGKMFRNMSSEGFCPDGDMYNTLFQGYSRTNNRRKLEEVLGIMTRRSISLSISSYRNCVRMMCMEGRFLFVLSLKEMMVTNDPSRCLIVYNILIFYLLSRRNTLLVKRCLDEIREKGLELDEVTYNFLVYGFSKCGNKSSSVRYFSSMISKGLNPNRRSFRTVITLLCDLGKVEEALELSREMESRGLTHVSVVQNAIASGLLSNGKLDETERFLNRVMNKDLIPDTINYDNLIKKLCKIGRLNTSVDLVNTMLKKGNVPNSASYDSVIRGFCTCDKLNEATDFFAEMLDRSLTPSVDTRNLLVNRLCRTGKTVEAESVLVSMVRLGEKPSKEMFYTLIDRYRFENNLGKVSELMQMMQRNGYEPDFDAQWSLISNLSNPNEKDKTSNGFLSRLLSGSGFVCEKGSKVTTSVIRRFK